jgi:hypothetical protein
MLAVTQATSPSMLDLSRAVRPSATYHSCRSARALPAAAAVDADATMHSDTTSSATPGSPSSTPPAAADAAGQQGEAAAPAAAAAAAAAAAPAKRPAAASVLRAVVRPMWGTATLPLRILVRPAVLHDCNRLLIRMVRPVWALPPCRCASWAASCAVLHAVLHACVQLVIVLLPGCIAIEACMCLILACSN